MLDKDEARVLALRINMLAPRARDQDAGKKVGHLSRSMRATPIRDGLAAVLAREETR